MRCEIAGCNNIMTVENRGAKIGYQINNLNRELRACNSCAMKVMAAPRGTFEITKHKELKFITRPTIIT